MPQAESRLVVTGTFTMKGYEAIETGWRVHFENLNPGPDRPTDYFVFLDYTEITPQTSQNALRTLLTEKLQAAHGPTGYAPLQAFQGQSITV